MNKINKANDNLIQELVTMVEHARHSVAMSVNSEITRLYWNIGRKINEDILSNSRAEYGKQIIKEISDELSQKYGHGFSKRNIHNFVKFNELYPNPDIVQTLSAQLSWSHITILIAIPDEIKRSFYTHISQYELWSVRTLRNRIDSMLYERTAISKKPETTIKKDLEHLQNRNQMTPDLTFRDPYFLDFLGLKHTYSENDLETAILANLQDFITELGSDFAFLSRQKRIIIDNDDYFIDLLFYHRSLQCLVAIDLKLGKFKAAYKGQMELYLGWLELNEQKENENKPVGLILCSEKSPEQISYLMLQNHEHIKVAEYQTLLPHKKLLEEKLHKAIEIAKNQLNKS